MLAQRLFFALSSLGLSAPLLASAASAPERRAGGQSDQAGWPVPIANLGSNGGWTGAPQVDGATLDTTFQVADGVTFMNYITKDYDPATVQRVVIVFPGKPRDSWNYWNIIRNSLDSMVNDTTRNPPVDKSKFVIASPLIWNRFDLLDGAVNTTTDLSFYGDNWADGGDNKTPSGKNQRGISSFDAFDRFVDYFMDLSKFPKVSRVVIAGHSLGAQAVQRYAVIRKQQVSDPRLFFWVANPGSWQWMVTDRPAAIGDNCTATFDDYKFGLAGKLPLYDRSKLNKMGRDAIYARSRARNMHIAIGSQDDGPGDTSCEALSQGSTHRERGQNFQTMLANSGGFPSTYTFDLIDPCTHDNVCMMNSQMGLQRIFLDGLDAAIDPATTSEPQASHSGNGGRPRTDQPRGDGATSLLGGVPVLSCSLALLGALFAGMA